MLHKIYSYLMGLSFVSLFSIRENQSLSQNVGTIAAIRGHSDKIEWFWDTLLIFPIVF
ncbi:hypothetical protein LEP1GSC038_2567 [Leptospira weilii str. 2006001855]|uniref:Uncharacterized protein n=1 Tax=Leptospira weilii str. 2006001855 TaxID=996804 RepID=M6FRD7_9LEPT|nr:hypothetical protein LEP1GSC038_2567 [Leptospira weilii str. 2006001855]